MALTKANGRTESVALRHQVNCGCMINREISLFTIRLVFLRIHFLGFCDVKHLLLRPIKAHELIEKSTNLGSQRFLIIPLSINRDKHIV